MEGWSLLFTLIAVGGVLLTFAGAWWMVRLLRARKPRPSMREDRSESSGSPR